MNVIEHKEEEIIEKNDIKKEKEFDKNEEKKIIEDDNENKNENINEIVREIIIERKSRMQREWVSSQRSFPNQRSI